MSLVCQHKPLCLDQREIQTSCFLLTLPPSPIWLGITAIMTDCSGRCYLSCWSAADSRTFQSHVLGKQCPCQLPLLLTGFEHNVLRPNKAPEWDNHTIPTSAPTPTHSGIHFYWSLGSFAQSPRAQVRCRRKLPQTIMHTYM